MAEITLTLGEEQEEEKVEEVVTPEETEVEVAKEVHLSPEEQKQVDDFSKKIDITSSSQILQYGSTAQKKLSDFSDTALSKVKTQDLGEVGDMITSLVVELKGFDIDAKEKGSIKGFFKKEANKITGLKARYDKAEVNVNKIVGVLEDHQVQLMKDITMLDQLYETNQNNHKELTMYILAGKQRLKQAKEVELPALIAKAKESGLQEDSQAANDFAQMCDRFEKKIYDLELSRTISVQMAPQIRLVQNNDTLMVEKIQSTLVNTIPLWKSQMVLALGINHSTEAMKAEREVNDLTNKMLKSNADKLKIATVETAKESERGIVELETLQYTNQQLIDTLDEVLAIQKEGHAKREAASEELNRIENELKKKLLEVNH